MTRPFLEVVTRCYLRPIMLAENQCSLDAQTDSDWSQMLLHDRQGYGVGISNQKMKRTAKRLTGDYIWILDDDDMAIRETLVEELKAIAAEHDPDVVMMRMDHGPRGILPDDDYWGRRPEIGHVGCSAYVVKRAVWLAHADAWRNSYTADGEFIRAIFDSDPVVYWHDVVASRTQRISLGAPE